MAWVFVPFVSHLRHGLGTYRPGDYEPRDTARLVWLAKRGARRVSALRGEVLVNAGAFVLLGMLWLAIMRARR